MSGIFSVSEVFSDDGLSSAVPLASAAIAFALTPGDLSCVVTALAVALAVVQHDASLACTSDAGSLVVALGGTLYHVECVALEPTLGLGGAEVPREGGGATCSWSSSRLMASA